MVLSVTYLALSSAKPPSTLSNTPLLMVASGMKGTSACSVCSITVRTALSCMAHSCTRMGTQLCLNTLASILPSDASFASTFTLTCIDCWLRRIVNKGMV